MCNLALFMLDGHCNKEMQERESSSAQLCSWSVSADSKYSLLTHDWSHTGFLLWKCTCRRVRCSAVNLEETFLLCHVFSEVGGCGTCFPCLLLVFGWDSSEYRWRSMVFWPEGTEWVQKESVIYVNEGSPWYYCGCGWVVSSLVTVCFRNMHFLGIPTVCVITSLFTIFVYLNL